jgi:hypothetical protein
MNLARFAERHPLLYHMAHDGSWPNIQRYGLRSTTALLDLFEVSGEERVDLEAHWRRETIAIEHPRLGTAWIRDQLPLRPSRLAQRLTGGMDPSDWYQLLNSFVFFWVDEEHLQTLVRARAYRDLPQTILTFETAELLDRHRDQVRLSSINSGSLLRGGAYRGPNTFTRIESFQGSRVVELCIPGAIPDAAEFVLSVQRREPSGATTTLFER